MKVKKLIKILEKLNQDAEIMLSIDEEGNDFKPIIDVTEEEPPSISLPAKKYIIFPKG